VVCFDHFVDFIKILLRIVGNQFVKKTIVHRNQVLLEGADIKIMFVTVLDETSIFEPSIDFFVNVFMLLQVAC
jgi:hypothetical protein